MSIYDNLFNETKTRFEGKRVLKVDPDYKFHMDDGTAFYLDYSQGAGLFTKDAPGGDGLCKSLTTWLEECNKHLRYDEVPIVVRSDDQETVLVMIAPNNAESKLDITSLSEKELEFVNTTDLNDLAQLAPMGDCWMCCVKDVDGKLVIKDEWKAGWLDCIDGG